MVGRGGEGTDLSKALARSLDDVPGLVKRDQLLAVKEFGNFEGMQRRHELFRDSLLLANVPSASTR